MRFVLISDSYANAERLFSRLLPPRKRKMRPLLFKRRCSALYFDFRYFSARSQLLLVELATTLFHSPPSRFQAAAAARIKGQPSIHQAARSGNAGLVRDHIVADPAAVHVKGGSLFGGYVVLPLFYFLKTTR